MTRQIRPALALALLISTVFAACGGQGGSPTAPSSGSAAGGAGTSVVISGTVRTGAALLSDSTGASMAGLIVTVVGTAISTSVDGANHFTLTGVPAGEVQLRFSGPGIETTVTLSQLQPADTVTLVVHVSGTTVEVEAEQRAGTAEHGQELEGRVEALPPTTAAGALTVAGRTVLTTASTKFVQGSAVKAFADLQIGMRVHVKGAASGSDLSASEVRIQNTNTWIPVEVNGVIDSFAPGAVFQFKVGSRLVKGDDLTKFFGSGDTAGSIALLADGVRVEVKGQQRDGYVYAERIHVNAGGDAGKDDKGKDDDGKGDGQDSSASIHGTLTAVGGSKPALALTVGGTSVRTTAATTVKRRGDVQTLDQLKIGQSLHVVGDRQADASIAARLIEIDDDAEGGAFEIEGSAGGVKGACPALTFSVNGFTVSTDSSTTFEGGACSTLRSGDKVSVKGTKQANGSVLATRVKR